MALNKESLYEEIIDRLVTATSDVPETDSETGEITGSKTINPFSPELLEQDDQLGGIEDSDGNKVVTKESLRNITLDEEDYTHDETMVKCIADEVIDHVSISASLNDLSDVEITNLETGEVLYYDGSSWVNRSVSAAGGGSDIDMNVSSGRVPYASASNTLSNSPIKTNGSLIWMTGDAKVGEISKDGTLNSNSDAALVTEKAIKTYVDNSVSSVSASESDWERNTEEGYLYPKETGDAISATNDLYVGRFLKLDVQEVTVSADNVLLTPESSLIFIDTDGGLASSRSVGIADGETHGQVIHISVNDGSMEFNDSVSGSADIVDSPLQKTSSDYGWIAFWWNANTSQWIVLGEMRF